jgi:hypothetical protein
MNKKTQREVVKIGTAKNQKDKTRKKKISELKQFKGKIDLDIDLDVLRDRKK